MGDSKFKTEIAAGQHYGGWPQAVIHNNFEPDQRGRFAMALIERWGLVMGEPDGEDSAGRSKLRLMDAKDVVDRAIETAKLAYEKMERDGMLVEMPSLEELRDMAREERDRN